MDEVVEFGGTTVDPVDDVVAVGPQMYVATSDFVTPPKGFIEGASPVVA